MKTAMVITLFASVLAGCDKKETPFDAPAAATSQPSAPPTLSTAAATKEMTSDEFRLFAKRFVGDLYMAERSATFQPGGGRIFENTYKLNGTEIVRTDSGTDSVVGIATVIAREVHDIAGSDVTEFSTMTIRFAKRASGWVVLSVKSHLDVQMPLVPITPETANAQRMGQDRTLPLEVFQTAADKSSGH